MLVAGIQFLDDFPGVLLEHPHLYVTSERPAKDCAIALLDTQSFLCPAGYEPSVKIVNVGNGLEIALCVITGTVNEIIRYTVYGVAVPYCVRYRFKDSNE